METRTQTFRKRQSLTRDSRVIAGNRGHGPSDATDRWTMAGLGHIRVISALAAP